MGSDAASANAALTLGESSRVRWSTERRKPAYAQQLLDLPGWHAMTRAQDNATTWLGTPLPGFRRLPSGAYQLMNPASESALLVNPSGTERFIACAETGLRRCDTLVDIDGLPVAATTAGIRLPARSTRLVRVNDGYWSR